MSFWEIMLVRKKCCRLLSFCVRLGVVSFSSILWLKAVSIAILDSIFLWCNSFTVFFLSVFFDSRESTAFYSAAVFLCRAFFLRTNFSAFLDCMHIKHMSYLKTNSRTWQAERLIFFYCKKFKIILK